PFGNVDESDIGNVRRNTRQPLGEVRRNAQLVAGARERATEQRYRLGVGNDGHDAKPTRVITHETTSPANTRRAGPLSVTSKVSRATVRKRVPPGRWTSTRSSRGTRPVAAAAT